MTRWRFDARSGAGSCCVLGGMDLVRPLALAGLRPLVVARPGSPALHSRSTAARLPWTRFDDGADDLVETLLRWAATEPIPPALFYEEDAHLLLVSRRRERLGGAFRFVLAEADLVEDLVDKARFQALAERLRLPVPATRRLRPAVESVPDDADLRYPAILKPLTRRDPWDAVGGGRKAIPIASPAELRRLWPQLGAVGMELLLQEEIPGPETAIESHHVYVDGRGTVAGEFTGRKIRTFPAAMGHSTALEITDAPDVAALGRDLVDRLGLAGVAKLDFKRSPDGRLHLLEVNPRFNLWHHLGAVAGVNLPALVFADLHGLKRPPVAKPRAGARWCSPWNDWPAARAQGVSLAAWLPWAAGCQAVSAMAWDDPWPPVGAALGRLLPAGGRSRPAAGALRPAPS